MTDTSDPSSAPPRPIAEINTHIRNTLEREIRIRHVTVIGTVVRIKTPPSGHVYFDISENDYSIPCFLHQSIARSLDFKVRQGMKLEISGTIRVYDKALEVQIDIEEASIVEAAPSHNLLELETMLKAEGVWRTNKHRLPPHIRTIGLITSRYSQALEDFRQAYLEDGGTARIEEEHVLLEGDRAVQSITDAITKLSRRTQIDVIAIVRGGGQELGIFDDLLIARAICQSEKPIVTGLGHADDETLADRAADFSADAPGRAATMLARHETSALAITPPITSTPQPTEKSTVPMIQATHKWPKSAILSIAIILAVLVAILGLWLVS